MTQRTYRCVSRVGLRGPGGEVVYHESGDPIELDDEKPYVAAWLRTGSIIEDESLNETNEEEAGDALQE